MGKFGGDESDLEVNIEGNSAVKTMNNMDNKTSIIKKQKTFLNDLANHHEDGDDRHMSFGTNMPSTSVRAVGKTMKSRKTVKFIDNEIGDNA